MLVRTLYSAISRGTESLVFHGRVPPSEHARMKGPHQQGEFPWPVKYGYCNVGVVEDGEASLRGREVFCLYPHQTRYTVAADSVVPLPAGLPASRAVLAANMETAINGLWDAQLGIGDRVGVIGAGVVGCLVAYLAARVAGCEVQLIDLDERKRAVADALGVPFRSPEEASGELDRVIDTSGSPAALSRALELAGAEATVVEMSWFGDRPATLSLGGAFHSRRLRIISSQVGAIPLPRRARWTYRRRLELALRLLADDALDALLDGDSRFEDLPQTMAQVTKSDAFVLCHRVVYG